MKKKFLLFSAILYPALLFGMQYRITSPDGRLSLVAEGTTIAVEKDGRQVILPSEIGLTLDNGSVWDCSGKPRRIARRSNDNTIEPIVYKKSVIEDKYNELSVAFKDFEVIFRAYDDAVAYRFVSKLKKDVYVVSEKVELAFPEETEAFVPYVRTEGSFEEQFNNFFENQYRHIRLEDWDKNRLAFLPITFESSGKYVCVTEADLLDFPGLYFSNTNGDRTLEAVHAPYPSVVRQGGYNSIQGMVLEREKYLAHCRAKSELPWRVFVVADEPKDLIGNDIVYKLASPSAPGLDWNWVKPGKVAWDWWNDWNIKGVDFKAGINTDTYKYYIDFASNNGVEYVILDEGWSTIGTADLYDVVAEIDLPALVDYADSKGVGLILWAGYWAFQKDPEGLCRHYSQMGIKGFKIDFMDRDDQPMVNFYREAAEVAAKYHLVLDFHGAFKPSGLQRMYPNVLNFEGVFGEEMQKFLDISWDQMENDCTIPFARMVAGSLDYTPGAMRNSTKSSFAPIPSEPMSQGTRCHQLALYAIFDAPLLMLCDSPSNYMAEPACFEYISDIPTTWDETVGIDGKISDYVVVARRKGDSWYVGAITDWNERDIEIEMDFLPVGQFELTSWADGVNAHRNATDYIKSSYTVSRGDKVSIHLAPGGGWAARIVVKNNNQ